jgi:hypothetical protein
VARRIVLSLDQTAFAHQAFYGTSENAVKTQIWTAISVYLLVGHPQKTSFARPQPLQTLTDPQRHAFRKNAHFTGDFQCRSTIFFRPTF